MIGARINFLFLLAVSPELCENFSRGQHRQAMLKRFYRNDNKRYHTAGAVDDIKVSIINCAVHSVSNYSHDFCKL